MLQRRVTWLMEQHWRNESKIIISLSLSLSLSVTHTHSLSHFSLFPKYLYCSCMLEIIYLQDSGVSRCAFAHLHDHGTNLPISNFKSSKMTCRSLLASGAKQKLGQYKIIKCILYSVNYEDQIFTLKIWKHQKDTQTDIKDKKTE